MFFFFLKERGTERHPFHEERAKHRRKSPRRSSPTDDHDMP